MVGRLCGPVDLLLFSQDIIKFTLCASVDDMNNDFSLGWWKKYWNDLFENVILVLVFSAIELK